VKLLVAFQSGTVILVTAQAFGESSAYVPECLVHQVGLEFVLKADCLNLAAFLPLSTTAAIVAQIVWR
jgi:hypothetical protein